MPTSDASSTAGESYRTVISAQGAQLLIEVNGVPHRVSRDDRGFVRSLAPAVVVSIPVAPGDEVARGDVVAVLESMKMESSLTAPFPGRVREVLVRPNVQVLAQAPLLQLDPLEGRGGAQSDPARLLRGRRGAAPGATAALPGEPPSASSGWCSATTSTPTRAAGSPPSSTPRAAT